MKSPARFFIITRITRIRRRLKSYFEGGGSGWARLVLTLRQYGLNWARALRRLTLRQTVGRAWPQRVLNRTATVLQITETNAGDAHGLTDFELLESARQIEVDESRYAEFLSQTVYPPCAPLYLRPVFLCRLHDTKWHPSEGLLRTRDDTVLMDSASAPYRLANSWAYGGPAPRPALFLEGCYSSVWSWWAKNSFHWLIDCLPRLYALAQAAPRPLTLLMPESATRYQRESLACCLPGGMEVRYLPLGGWVGIEEFVLPSYVTLPYFAALPAACSAYMRQSAFEHLGLASEGVARHRIYISRRNAHIRRVVNEPEVLEFLDGLGFKSYSLETLSFTEQVALFHDAEVVVAPHGAGLSNLLFAGKIKVVEMQAPPLRLHYFFLSQSLGQNYEPVIAEQRPSSENFVVPMESLKRALALFS